MTTSILVAYATRQRHRGELAHVPVAVFGMGPRNDDEEAWRRSRAQLDRALTSHGWLAPAAVAARRPGPERPRPERSVEQKGVGQGCPFLGS